MWRPIQRYVLGVLLWHGLVFGLILLICALLLVIAYDRSLRRVEELAGLRQVMVARQSAEGLAGHFDGVLQNLELLSREELDGLVDEQLGQNPVMRRATDRVRERVSELAPERLTDRAGDRAGERPDMARMLAARRILMPAIWRQIEQRATHLCAWDPDRGIVQSHQRDGAIDIERIIGAQSGWLIDSAPRAMSVPFVIDGKWMCLVSVRAVSGAASASTSSGPGSGSGSASESGSGSGSGSALPGAGVPARELPGLRFVAVVPFDEVSRRFIDQLDGATERVFAVLMDDDARVIYSPDPRLIGTRFGDDDRASERFRQLADEFRQTDRSGHIIVETTEPLGALTLDPSLVALHPVMLPTGERWRITVTSPLSDVREPVNDIFRGVLIYAPLVVIALSGVMMSTAIAMIRQRSRLERLRAEALRGELEQARAIQLKWLPQEALARGPVRVAAANRPASHVSGDFYNWIEMADGRVAVLIGDVSGHGLPAAFLMSTTQLMLRSMLIRSGDAGDTLDLVNEELCQQNFSGQFVTILVLVIDPKTRTCHATSAGHPMPLMSSGGLFSAIEFESQLIAGIMPGVDYVTASFELPEQCSIVLYTDGVVECASESGERFSAEELAPLIDPSITEPGALLEEVLSEVDRFRGKRPLDDDATAVVIRFDATKAVG